MQPWSQPLLWTKVSVCVPQTLTGPTVNAGTNTPNNAIGATGSMTASTFAENTLNANHNVNYTTGATVAANSKMRGSAWIARGTGTNNRYVRFMVINSLSTYGFFTELDLQAGTAGAPVALGTGSLPSGSGATITPVGTGFNVSVTGVLSTTQTGPPFVWMSSETVPGTFFYVGTGTQCFAYESVGLCIFS